VWENTLEAFDQWRFERFLVPPPDWGPGNGTRERDAK
jgi:catechol 2,3-dioxygenase